MGRTGDDTSEEHTSKYVDILRWNVNIESIQWTQMKIWTHKCTCATWRILLMTVQHAENQAWSRDWSFALNEMIYRLNVVGNSLCWNTYLGNLKCLWRTGQASTRMREIEIKSIKEKRLQMWGRMQEYLIAKKPRTHKQGQNTAQILKISISRNWTSNNLL